MTDNPNEIMEARREKEKLLVSLTFDHKHKRFDFKWHDPNGRLYGVGLLAEANPTREDMLEALETGLTTLKRKLLK